MSAHLIPDAKRVLSWTATAVMVIPFCACRYPGDLLRWLADRMQSGNHRLYRWANPEVFGDRPPGGRKWFYRRRTVERLCKQIESLNREIAKQKEPRP